MDNNRGQTIFLSVIGIATLLVAIIGATFAYFTTQVTGSGTGGSLEGTTAKISGTTLTFTNNELETYDYLKYPGGLAIFGTKAEFAKDDPTDKNDYIATFDLQIDYTNPTDTALDYTLYMVEDSSIEANLDPKCKLLTKVSGNETYLLYGNDGDDISSLSDLSTIHCKLNSQALAVLSGTTAIASGTLEAKKTEDGKIDKDTQVGGDGGLIQQAGKDGKNPFGGRQLDTKNTNTKYYYLLVDYPNENKPQNSDENATITVSLTITPGSIKVDQGTVSTE